METLSIQPTEHTPAVTLDDVAQIFLIEGESYPESAHKFYAPVIEWLSKYEKVLHTQKQVFEKNRRMTFQFKFDYFNSTSAKYINDIISLLAQLKNEGCEVRVKWFYEKQDTDMKEAGEEFAKSFPRLPVKYVEREKQITQSNPKP